LFAAGFTSVGVGGSGNTADAGGVDDITVTNSLTVSREGSRGQAVGGGNSYSYVPPKGRV